jgi:hypothetical protein
MSGYSAPPVVLSLAHVHPRWVAEVDGPSSDLSVLRGYEVEYECVAFVTNEA